jgi:hypothetical protein
MKKEQKFITAVMFRNLFTLITLAFISIYVYTLSIFLLIGLISFLLTFVFEQRIKGELLDETIAFKKEQEELRKKADLMLKGIKDKVNEQR